MSSSSAHAVLTATTQYAVAAPLKQTLLQLVLGGPSNPPVDFLESAESLEKSLSSLSFPSRAELISHSRRQWDTVLRFIVEGEKRTPLPAEDGRGGAGALREGGGGADFLSDVVGGGLGGGKKRKKNDHKSGAGGGYSLGVSGVFCEDLVKVREKGAREDDDFFFLRRTQNFSFVLR